MLMESFVNLQIIKITLAPWSSKLNVLFTCLVLQLRSLVIAHELQHTCADYKPTAGEQIQLLFFLLLVLHGSWWLSS